MLNFNVMRKSQRAELYSSTSQYGIAPSHRGESAYIYNTNRCVVCCACNIIVYMRNHYRYDGIYLGLFAIRIGEYAPFAIAPILHLKPSLISVMCI